VKLISPVDHPGEAQDLLEAGADELYGGFLSEAWRSRFGSLVSSNQRSFEAAQIPSEEEFVEIVRLVRAAGKGFALTLNAPFYSAEQIPLILAQVERAAKAGIHGVILADPGLLLELKTRFPHLDYQASTLARLSSSASVRFFRRQGMTRAILPRHLSVEEMGDIIADCPDLLFDAFLLVGKCPNSEGLCSFSHDSLDRIWPCEIPYRIEAASSEPSGALKAAMERQGSWSRTNRRHGCGLCAVPELLEAGVTGLKLVGRGAPGAQKIRNLKLASDFLALAGQDLPPEVYRERARSAHRARFGAACSANVCYYPEFYRGE